MRLGSATPSSVSLSTAALAAPTICSTKVSFMVSGSPTTGMVASISTA